MATVSARVPDELKDRLSEENIEVSEVIRKALKEEIERRRREKIEEKAEDLSRKLDIGDEEIVKSIREDRENR
ncbi:MAG: hypothetical protein ABEJ56_00485 [Candidatus Nanohaloarchaea archaeon]